MVILIIIIALALINTLLPLFLYNLYMADNRYPATGISGDGCLVLSYHLILKPSIVQKFTYKYFITNSNEQLKYFTILDSDFQREMEYLRQMNVNFATPDELLQFMNGEIKLPPKSVIVTFDDVDESVYNNAFPFLKQEKIPFTLFVITGWAGSSNYSGLKLCSWEQIKDMYRTGLASVGSHTNSFHYYDKSGKPAFLNPLQTQNFKEDIDISIKTLEKELNLKPKIFAYPYGFGTEENDKIIKNAGFDMIYTLESGVTKKGDDPYFIKRVLVTKDNWGIIAKWAKSK